MVCKELPTKKTPNAMQQLLFPEMQELKKPLFLLSNDDGIYAPGLRYLIETLRPVADLFVVAPDSPRSGGGMSITITNPVTVRLLRDEPGLTEYSCSGTPVDCIKMAFSQLLGNRRPELVVSGINHGDNAGINVHYSGTMGAVIEGALQGFPAIGFSLCDHSEKADFTPLRDHLIDFVFKTIAVGLPPYTCLNVNFPKTNRFLGTKICRMGHSRWTNEFARRKRPGGGYYYWLTGEAHDLHPEDVSMDTNALKEGYIAVTPIRLDMTSEGLFEVLQQVM